MIKGCTADEEAAAAALGGRSRGAAGAGAGRVVAGAGKLGWATMA